MEKTVVEFALFAMYEFSTEMQIASHIKKEMDKKYS